VTSLSIPYSSGPALHHTARVATSTRFWRLSIPYSSGPALHLDSSGSNWAAANFGFQSPIHRVQLCIVIAGLLIVRLTSLSIPYSSGPALHPTQPMAPAPTKPNFQSPIHRVQLCIAVAICSATTTATLSIPYSSGPALHLNLK